MLLGDRNEYAISCPGDGDAKDSRLLWLVLLWLHPVPDSALQTSARTRAPV